jgi:hypothetical protein
MEIQTTRSSELAKPEWLPLRSGSSEANLIFQARSTQTLRLRHEEDIKQVLRYVMVLVGLRGQNLPSEEERFMLLNFIRSNFGNQTPEEIKLAFEWAVAGRLNIDAKCYENFSCEYFGRIMKAYIDMATEETRSVKKEPDIELPPPSDEEQRIQAIVIINSYANQIQKCKKSKKEFTWITGGLHELYKSLIKFKIQTISKEEMLELWRKSENIKDEEERKTWCRTQSYILLANQLADFDARIDQDGLIKPIEE